MYTYVYTDIYIYNYIYIYIYIYIGCPRAGQGGRTPPVLRCYSVIVININDIIIIIIIVIIISLIIVMIAATRIATTNAHIRQDVRRRI